MKTMALSEYGPNSVFALTELPKPTADTGHVIVRVQATSINTIDMMIRNMGTDLGFAPATPAVLGMDFAGTIEEVGEGVTVRINATSTTETEKANTAKIGNLICP